MVHTDVLADISLHQEIVSECMTSLTIKLSCNSRREREQGGRMTADCLMEMLKILIRFSYLTNHSGLHKSVLSVH